jgi:hypothetical protein
VLAALSFVLWVQPIPAGKNSQSRHFCSIR